MFRKPFVLAIILLGSISLVFAWGSWGHQHINHAAIFALPEQMRSFFYNHIDYVTEEAVGPDIRKYSLNDRAESPRHYINLEVFGINTMDSLPSDLQQLKAKYPDSVIQKAGSLPWYILQMEDKLTKAFKARRKTEILFLASDLAHYIGDASMPLHTSVNHDGQLTNQKGIHAFFEGQLPELFGEEYNLNTGNAKYIDDITKETWHMIQVSFLKADTLLAVERKLKETFPKEKIFRLDSNGNVMKNKFNDPVHSYEYAKKYHEMLNGMIERQIRQAISEASNFWYTAWVNAGKPNLSELDPESLTKRNEENFKKDNKLWQEGRVSGFRPEQEFNK
ncbi:MAG TPA: zinc dependent phospholipase C family protein [Puia sp.]|nr:zinc dependent phospholipase C family protein [Puia sp.]